MIRMRGKSPEEVVAIMQENVRDAEKALEEGNKLKVRDRVAASAHATMPNPLLTHCSCTQAELSYKTEKSKLKCEMLQVRSLSCPCGVATTVAGPLTPALCDCLLHSRPHIHCRLVSRTSG